MRVLIADDDPASVRLLGASLDKLGHEVVQARDGRQALDLYAEDEFPLVIADWLMPGMTGIELCEAIRGAVRSRYSYVVIATTLSAQENTLEGFRAGADDYLVKPYSVEELETRIVVAERVCNGMDAKVEMTMRDVVEMCQSGDGETWDALRERVRKLADYYRTRRAQGKARAFLRRQIVRTKEQGPSAAASIEVERLVRELELVQELEDDSE